MGRIGERWKDGDGEIARIGVLAGGWALRGCRYLQGHRVLRRGESLGRELRCCCYCRATFGLIMVDGACLRSMGLRIGENSECMCGDGYRSYKNRHDDLEKVSW